MTIISAVRYHDISCGHRVVGHESKCKYLHGHNYRIHFYIQSDGLDDLGRVLDFGVIKSILCEWLEENWDHRFLIWEKDPLLNQLMEVSNESLRVVPFNPTAENMGEYLLTIGNELLKETGCVLTKIRIEETRKCSVDVE